ncbi:tyrosine-type recombinase/integrase [Massilicoli timonensis]|uniref:tyrosine-type recombinase/integrase n=1 Tax=Massilicoli timonensis TaxID=2015901 RepID=UPI0030790466
MMEQKDLELFQQFLAFQQMQEQKQLKPKKFIPRRREKGNGSVYRLSGNRRKPWIAAIQTGIDPITGKPIRETKTFATKEQAITWLDTYNLQRKGIIANSDIASKHNVNYPTVDDIWDKIDISKKSKSTQHAYLSAYNRLHSIHKTKMYDLNLHILQPIFDKMEAKKLSSASMNHTKTVLSMIFDYAIKYDYIEKNYADYIKYSSAHQKITKKAYSHDDIHKLFLHDDNIVIQFILISIYTGMRGGEILALKKENIHVEEGYMIGGLKTKNGINRIIPIHDYIKKYVKNFATSKYLGMTYDGFKYHFDRAMNDFEMDGYTIHSGRHTFATLANEYELNEYLTKKIMGHSSNDLTKDVYTHASKERLITEVNKLPIF